MVVFVGMLSVWRGGWTIGTVGVAGLLLSIFLVTYFGLRMVMGPMGDKVIYVLVPGRISAC